VPGVTGEIAGPEAKVERAVMVAPEVPQRGGGPHMAAPVVRAGTGVPMGKGALAVLPDKAGPEAKEAAVLAAVSLWAAAQSLSPALSLIPTPHLEGEVGAAAQPGRRA
jgi:hypothetical protein